MSSKIHRASGQGTDWMDGAMVSVRACSCCSHEPSLGFVLATWYLSACGIAPSL